MRIVTMCQAHPALALRTCLAARNAQLITISTRAAGNAMMSRIASQPGFSCTAGLQCYLSPVRSLHLSNHRPSAAVKRKPLPFEVNSNVPRDTLVYQYKNDRFFKFITVFGLVQWIFWLNLASLSYTGNPTISEDELKKTLDDSTILGKMVIYQSRYKYKVATVCMVVGESATNCIINVLWAGRSGPPIKWSS